MLKSIVPPKLPTKAAVHPPALTPHKVTAPKPVSTPSIDEDDDDEVEDLKTSTINIDELSKYSETEYSVTLTAIGASDSETDDYIPEQSATTLMRLVPSPTKPKKPTGINAIPSIPSPAVTLGSSSVNPKVGSIPSIPVSSSFTSPSDSSIPALKLAQKASKPSNPVLQIPAFKSTQPSNPVLQPQTLSSSASNASLPSTPSTVSQSETKSNPSLPPPEDQVSQINDSASRLMLPNPGDTFENYQIIEMLGEGGFGAVYRAKNLTLGREEALKIILPEALVDNKKSDKRFLREVDIISRIEHPNVVRLYNSGSHVPEGLLWMSMELIEGTRLDYLLKEKGKLTFAEGKEILSQLLSGLQEAQRHQLIHRDLKPANIMLTHKEGYGTLVIILDFGLAKALGAEENTQLQQLSMMTPKFVMGTPQYMAPEQFQPNIPPGAYTDIYSAALIFIELITGQSAVNGATPVEVAYHQMKNDVELPPEWKGTALEKLIQKATAKDPAERYQTAQAFHDDLDCIQAITDSPDVFKNRKETHHDGLQFTHHTDTPQIASNGPTNILEVLKNKPVIWFYAFIGLLAINFVVLILVVAL